MEKIIYLFFEGLKNIWRHKTTSFIAVAILSIALYGMGILVIAGDNTQKVIHYFRGKYKIEVFFDKNISNQEALGIVHKIKKIKGIRTATLIEKEDALRIFKDQFNEDINNILGYNPLPASVVINLSRTMKGPLKIESIIKKIKEFKSIEKVIYQGSLIRKIEKNYKKLFDKLPYLSIIIISVAILIIYNTIRLSLYARKELINNLRLIGATKYFIIMPFLIEGALISIFSFFIVIPFLFGTVEGLNFLIENYSSFKVKVDIDMELLVTAQLIILLVSILSSYRASNSFLKL